MKTSGIFWESSTYAPEKVSDRFIAFRGDDLILFEVNSRNMTIRESYADPQNYSVRHIEQAKKLKGRWPNQVQIS